ncbi:uncharacterized protein LOC141632957 [Silene latifolia]|uniref:uncharacterized protein LOC141632957 n=1 Tax=Silene latifolia TaxID=37657 RepID=UPI003D76F744
MRIRGWGVRKLSYAGRLVLVQAVLTQLHNFWARIFLFPVIVLDRIERICMNYLWGGSEQFHKMPNVAWKKICRDRKHGELGIVHYRNWNLDMLGKFVWWLVSKADHMWIKWVNHIYIKGRDWLTYTPPIHSSWSWRMICKTKDKMKDGFCTSFWNKQNIYSAAKGYTWLQGSQIKVPWYPLIWNKVNSPKHAFIGWLAVQQKLMTKDRLLKYGIITNGRCDLCLNHIETHQHILYEFVFNAMCWSALKTWLGINMPNVGILEWSIHWHCRSLMKKQIVFAAILALIYHIWHAHNLCRVDLRVPRPALVVAKVKTDVQRRGQCITWGTKFQQMDWTP